MSVVELDVLGCVGVDVGDVFAVGASGVLETPRTVGATGADDEPGEGVTGGGLTGDGKSLPEVGFGLVA